MQILDYNRVVRDLNGNSKEEFLARVAEAFDLELLGEPFKPAQAGEFGMFLDEILAFRLLARDGHELPGLVALADQLPVALANHPLVLPLPVHHLVVARGVLGHDRHEASAVERAVGQLLDVLFLQREHVDRDGLRRGADALRVRRLRVVQRDGGAAEHGHRGQRGESAARDRAIDHVSEPLVGCWGAIG